MKTFKEYLSEKKVKAQSPDPAEAESLLKQAQARLADLLTLSLNEKNASFRFESAYECLREAVQSFMAREGDKPYSHEAVVVYSYEKSLLNEKEAISFDRYREKRNDLNYRGQKLTLEEAKEIITFAKNIFLKLRDIHTKK